MCTGGDHCRQADHGAEDGAGELFLVDPTPALQPDRTKQPMPAMGLTGGLGCASRHGVHCSRLRLTLRYRPNDLDPKPDAARR
jgi:hypothetical protein